MQPVAESCNDNPMENKRIHHQTVGRNCVTTIHKVITRNLVLSKSYFNIFVIQTKSQKGSKMRTFVKQKKAYAVPEKPVYE